MKKYERKSIFSSLNTYCLFARKDDYIEVTEWKNGEGFDVEVSSLLPQRFQLTFGEFKLLKKMIKELDK